MIARPTTYTPSASQSSKGSACRLPAVPVAMLALGLLITGCDGASTS